MRALLLTTICLFAVQVQAQRPLPSPMATPNRVEVPSAETETLKKANSRPADAPPPLQPDPFDGVSVEKMRDQCVTLDTEAGAIEIEFMPEVAPESVRNFLNVAAT